MQLLYSLIKAHQPCRNPLPVCTNRLKTLLFRWSIPSFSQIINRWLSVLWRRSISYTGFLQTPSALLEKLFPFPGSFSNVPFWKSSVLPAACPISPDTSGHAVQLSSQSFCCLPPAAVTLLFLRGWAARLPINFGNQSSSHGSFILPFNQISGGPYLPFVRLWIKNLIIWWSVPSFLLFYDGRRFVYKLHTMTDIKYMYLFSCLSFACLLRMAATTDSISPVL